MKKKTLIILSASLVILGVGGYFAYGWWKKRQSKEDEGSKDSSDSGSGSSTGTMDVKTNAPIVTAKGYSFPASWTKADGDKFRGWINDKFPDYAKKISLDRTGGLNQYLDTAYKAYGTTYLNSLNPFSFKVGDVVRVNYASQNLTKYKKTSSGWQPTGNKQNLSLEEKYTVAGYATFADGKRYVIIAPVGTTASFMPTSESNLYKA